MLIIVGIVVVVVLWFASPIAGVVSAVLLVALIFPRILMGKTREQTREFSRAAMETGVFNALSARQLAELQASWLRNGKPKGLSAKDYLLMRAGRPPETLSEFTAWGPFEAACGRQERVNWMKASLSRSPIDPRTEPGLLLLSRTDLIWIGDDASPALLEWRNVKQVQIHEKSFFLLSDLPPMSWFLRPQDNDPPERVTEFLRDVRALCPTTTGT
jgi:phosphate/sulfate permease